MILVPQRSHQPRDCGSALAPAGTPGAVIDRLHQAIAAYVASAEGQKKLSDMGMIPGAPTPPAELARFVAREVADWGKVVRQAGAAGIE